MDTITQLKKAIEESEKICVFTGAGISCPSGIPDFRSANGLYNQKSGYNYPPEEIISHSFFENNTELFYEFYKSKMVYENAKANAAHEYFAKLEKSGKDITVVTQNIDGLHQQAGSSTVYELHGSIHRNNCVNCGRFYGLSKILSSDGVPKCDVCGGIIKPDVVLYEEPLNDSVVIKAINAIENAHLMIVVGTSLSVYPAASYIRYFRGKTLALINKSATTFDSNADIVINDDIINVVNALK